MIAIIGGVSLFTKTRTIELSNGTNKSFVCDKLIDTHAMIEEMTIWLLQNNVTHLETRRADASITRRILNLLQAKHGVKLIHEFNPKTI